MLNRIDTTIIKQKSKTNRPAKVAKEIQIIISDIFAKSQINDPMLFDKMILISDVQISSDLSLARVYISPWEIEVDNAILLKTLNRYIPFFRHKIAKKLHIKIIPNLIFIIDNQFDKIDEAMEMFRRLNISTSKEDDKQ